MSSNSIPFIDVQIPLDNSIFDVQNLNNSLGNNMAFGKILQSIRPKWNMARVQIEVKIQQFCFLKIKLNT